MDSRGHGRSTRDARPYGYDLMADDVVALLDTLHIAKADVVGWSDGGILGLDLAIRHPDRVGKVFAFAANTVTSGVQEGVEKNPTFAASSSAPATNTPSFRRRPRNTTPSSRRSARCGRPSRTGPTRNCKSIQSPVLVVDGDHDEAIKRAHRIYRRDDPGRRAADPAQHQPFRVPAGPHAVQRGPSAFPR